MCAAATRLLRGRLQASKAGRDQIILASLRLIRPLRRIRARMSSSNNNQLGPAAGPPQQDSQRLFIVPRRSSRSRISHEPEPIPPRRSVRIRNTHGQSVPIPDSRLSQYARPRVAPLRGTPPSEIPSSAAVIPRRPSIHPQPYQPRMPVMISSPPRMHSEPSNTSPNLQNEENANPDIRTQLSDSSAQPRPAAARAASPEASSSTALPRADAVESLTTPTARRDNALHRAQSFTTSTLPIAHILASGQSALDSNGARAHSSILAPGTSSGIVSDTNTAMEVDASTSQPITEPEQAPWYANLENIGHGQPYHSGYYRDPPITSSTLRSTEVPPSEDEDRGEENPLEREPSVKEEPDIFDLMESVDSIAETNQVVLKEVQHMVNDFASLRRMVEATRAATPVDTHHRLRFQPKRHGHPKRRAERRTVFSRTVRDYLAHLVGGKEMEIHVHVSDDEAGRYADTWNADQGRSAPDCCDESSFRYYLGGTPKCPWNQSAGRVFVRSFRAWSQQDLDEGEILATFFSRLRTIIRTYRLRNNTAEFCRQHAAIMRRRGRKRTLFHQRLEVAQEQTFLQRHQRILELLGPDGMSSDESDYDSESSGTQLRGRPNYKVLRPRWRAPEVGPWMEVFDAVYIASRRQSNDRRGQYPRVRIRGLGWRSSSTKFIPYLPINAYDETWLSQQRNLDFTLRPNREQRYDFRHANEVISLIGSN